MQLSDFVIYVLLDLVRTDKNTQLIQGYNDMIMWVATHMPFGNYKFQSYVNTSIGVEDYPLPADLIHILHPIRFLEGSGTNDSGYEMNHLSKQEYDFKWPNPNRTSPPTDKPYDYCIYSRSILVGPVPDKITYLFEINWSKRVTDMSEDADVPSIGSEWDEIFKFGTLERVYAGMGQLDKANYWGGKYHRIDQAGDDIPIGMCAKLFQNEEDREEKAINIIENNSL